MIANYVENLRKKSMVRFILELALIIFVVKVPFVIATEQIFTYVGRADIVEMYEETQVIKPEFFDVLAGLVLAPILETVAGQWLPIGIYSFFSKNRKILILISSMWFMFMHYPVVTFFPAAFFAGIVLAWCWLEMRQQGLFKAFWVTTSVHFVHNALAFLAALAFFSL